MNTLELIRLMSEEQFRRILPAVRATKAGDLVTAKAVIEGMTAKELDILIAVLEEKLAEVRAV